jgi:hypothetical protein
MSIAGNSNFQQYNNRREIQFFYMGITCDFFREDGSTAATNVSEKTLNAWVM